VGKEGGGRLWQAGRKVTNIVFPPLEKVSPDGVGESERKSVETRNRVGPSREVGEVIIKARGCLRRGREKRELESAADI
jgi:hypothetical protein